jgi:hypothetical protein
MASLVKAKVHDQNGSFRMMVPRKWKDDNRLKTRDALDVIVSHALIVLPPRELTANEMEEIIRDLRQIMPARAILRE